MYYEDDSRGSNGCVTGALIIAVAILVVAGMGFYMFNRATNNFNRATENLNPFAGKNPLAAQPTEVRVDRPAVIQEVRSLNRLETSSYTVEKVIEAGQQGGALYNMLVGDKLLLIAHGDVIAGFDLSKMHDEDVVVSPDGSSATVTLPPAQILVSRLDNDKTRVYDRQRGLLTKGNVDLESEARRVAEQEILRAACDDGILTRATDEGKQRMTNLVQSLGIKEVTVNASPGSCTLPDGTPLPPAATPAP